MASDVKVRFVAVGKDELILAFNEVGAKSFAAAQHAETGWKNVNEALKATQELLAVIGFAATAEAVFEFARRASELGEEISVLSQRTATSSDTIQVFMHAANETNVATDQLAMGMARLGRSVQKMRDGNPEAIRDFRALGKDVPALVARTKDLGEVFKIVSERIGASTDPMQKVILAQLLLGRGGAALIPVMNAVAREGYDALAESARKYGLILDPGVIGASVAVTKQLRLMQEQAKVTTAEFTVNFAAKVLPIFKALSKDGDALKTFAGGVGSLLGDLLARFLSFYMALGTGVSTALYVVVNGLKTVFDTVSTFITTKGSLATKAVAAQAKAQWDAAFMKADLKERMDQASALLATVVKGPVKQKFDEATGATGGTDDALDPVGAKGKKKTLSDLVKELQDASRLFSSEFSKRLPIFSKDRTVQSEVFDKLRAEATDNLKYLERQRETIQINEGRGDLKAADAAKMLTKLNENQIPPLRERARLLNQIADISGDPKLIQWARDFALEVEKANDKTAKLADTMKKVADVVRGPLQSALEDTLGRGVLEAKTLGDLVLGFLRTLAAGIQQVLASRLATTIVNAIFGAPKAHTGGLLGSRGVNTGGVTGREVPMTGLVGEYFVRPDAVRGAGVLAQLQQINRTGRAVPTIGPGAVAQALRSVPAFGSAVSRSARGEDVVRLLLPEGFTHEHIRSNAGRRLIVEVAATERNAMRSALGVG